MDILHITAHMGGGAGKALSGTLIKGQELEPSVKQRVLCLEEPEEVKYIEQCACHGISVSQAGQGRLAEELERADVVVLHWWNHPRMARVLMGLHRLHARIVLWVHVSGCTYPRLPYELAERVDHVLFTTWYTYENPYWSQEEKERIRKTSSVIYGLGDLPSRKTAPDGAEETRGERPFTIGYVGTVHESKIHPRFLDYCSEVKKQIPSASFVFVGDNRLEQPWRAEADRLQLAKSIEFAGYVTDVERYLERFDAFGYLLNPYHFGTTENALLEAMAMELPVVALDQGVERYIIQNGKTGLLAAGSGEYASCMKRLYDSRALRRDLGRCASEYVKSEFNLEKNVRKVCRIFHDIAQQDKREYDFRRLCGTIPHEWFLKTAGREEELLRRHMTGGDPKQFGEALPPVLKGWSKGSVFHYARIFPEDDVLRHWAELLEAYGADTENRRAPK